MSQLHRDIYLENMKEWFDEYLLAGNLEGMEKIIIELREYFPRLSFVLEQEFKEYRSKIKIIV